MNVKDFITCLFPRTVDYRLSYGGVKRHGRPLTLTFSVTNLCQSRCRTCNIWQIYKWWPEQRHNELSLEEIEKIFRSIGRIYFFNISGGEPFLRKDLPEIVELACRHLRPRILHTPTNAIQPKVIEQQMRRIMETMRRLRLEVPFTIKPSYDGVGVMHDEVRGVKGNWNRLVDTIIRLKRLAVEFPNLHVEVGTVISNMNKAHLEDIEDIGHAMRVGSYRNEIAEQRTEFYNIGDPITPSGEEYADLIRSFSRKIWENIGTKGRLTRLTEALRIVYYDIAARIVKEKRQVIPCYAGISNVHLTPTGDLWPCCVLGYDKPMGNLRDVGYDFDKVWHSQQAQDVRRGIRNRQCACPLANQSYNNILIHYPSLMKAILLALRGLMKKPGLKVDSAMRLSEKPRRPESYITAEVIRQVEQVARAGSRQEDVDEATAS